MAGNQIVVQGDHKNSLPTFSEYSLTVLMFFLNMVTFMSFLTENFSLLLASAIIKQFLLHDYLAISVVNQHIRNCN